jgi:uncharacterized membrane protein YjgN (DUF898 family)
MAEHYPDLTLNPAAEADVDPNQRTIPMMFHGQAGAYFGIWIVNVLLTILTLGIWSAWAKVRTNRWFYGQTVLDGHAFEYHATGWQILRGRLLAVLLIALTTVGGMLVPWIDLVVILVFLVALPWIINASLRFTARVSSWRNVRFDFVGSYWRALGIFCLMPIAVMLTLGLLAPVGTRMAGRYVMGGYRFGGARCATDPRLSKLYAALGLSVLLFLVVCVGLPMALSLLPFVPSPLGLLSLLQAGRIGSVEDDPQRFMMMILPLILSFYAAIFVAALFYGALVRNEIVGQMRIEGGHRMRSTLSGLHYTWTALSGWIAALFTLGLLYPWAKVRLYRYHVVNTALLAAGDLDGFVSTHTSANSSFGSEFSQLEGISTGISF